MQVMGVKSKLQGRCEVSGGQRLASFIKLCSEKGRKKTSERQFSGDLGNSKFKISPWARQPWWHLVDANLRKLPSCIKFFKT
jgi:hypothetical protein